VLARSFFLKDKREGIPIVPACRACNQAKSKLEHYLSSVMPLAGRHPDSLRTLIEFGIRRLEQNQKLLRELSGGWRRLLGSPVGAGELPFQGDKFVEYMKMVVRGLAFDSFGLVLSGDHLVVGAMVSDEGAELMHLLFRARAKAKVSISLADNAFVCEGIQSANNDDFTVWRLKLYGIVANGDSEEGGPTSAETYVITCHKNSPAAATAQNLLQT
jgi:hypothetical protein